MRKNLILAFILVAGYATASEYEYRDRHGQVERYLVEEGSEIVVKDKYGFRHETINKDGEIRDEHGFVKGYIDVESE